MTFRTVSTASRHQYRESVSVLVSMQVSIQVSNGVNTDVSATSLSVWKSM